MIKDEGFLCQPQVVRTCKGQIDAMGGSVLEADRVAHTIVGNHVELQ